MAKNKKKETPVWKKYGFASESEFRKKYPLAGIVGKKRSKPKSKRGVN